MKYQYFPGCSLKGTGRAYEESLLEVFRLLSIDLQELDDWNCCGATAYMSINESMAFKLASRNLAKAAQGVGDLIAPCNACYLVLNKTQHYAVDYPEIRSEIEKSLLASGLKPDLTKKVRHPLDILVNDFGLQNLQGKISRPLKGLKVAPYYGCQVVRPYASFDDQRNPITMDNILRACGAEIVPYPLKTKCCGGSMTGTLPETGLPLSYHLIEDAIKRGADVIATVCPLCQFNLDAYQGDMKNRFRPNKPERKMPVVYMTQLLGLALGAKPEKLGMQRNIVPMEVSAYV